MITLLAGLAAASVACPKPAEGPGAPQLVVGGVSDLVLAPVEIVKFSPPLGAPPVPGRFGGAYDLDLKRDGEIRFVLFSAARIDVIAKGKALPVVSRAAGAGCSIIGYRLKKGDYAVQFSGALVPKLRVELSAK